MPNYHLVVVATELEIKLLEKQTHSDYKFGANYYQLADNINCLITGIGQYNTIKALTAHITHYGKPLSLLNIGIAGAYQQEVALTSIFKVAKDIAYDQKVISNNNILSWQDAQLPKVTSNIIEPKIPNYYSQLNIKEAVGLTSDTISDDLTQIMQIVKKYNPTVESMEGAAVFYIANQYYIPSMQIRALSNYVGDKDKSQWKIKESIEELNRFVHQHVLKILSNQ